MLTIINYTAGSYYKIAPGNIRKYANRKESLHFDLICGCINAFKNHWSVVICQAYRIYMLYHMLITHARIGIKNSWPRIYVGPAVLYWEGGIKAGFCIVIRRDHVHEISRKDRGRKREAEKGEEREMLCVR